MNLNRRQFLKTAALATAGVSFAPRPAFAVPQRRAPNLLFLHIDQCHIEAMSNRGCRYVHTPNMDRIAKRSVAFEQSYSANPVCCPARSVWYSGRPSSETGVVVNEVPMVEQMPDLGQWFGARGYEAAYAGKWHVPARPLDKSFKVLTPGLGIGEQGDAAVSRAAQAFLGNYAADKPFFLSLGFLQPHDICFWLFEHSENIERLPYPQLAGELPPLPANFKFDAKEPETFRKIWRDKPKDLTRMQWSELHWRYYLWSYYRHVEMVDAEIGRVLDALDDSPQASNTILVFSSDHGEGMAHHQMVTKHYLYDEAARVPLMISWPGQFGEGVTNRKHLVSGLDIAPTLCDFAGIDAPPKVRGRSLRALAEGRAPEWREFLVSESNTTGRMLRTPEFKLITYKGDATEQLFNMKNDPGETRNLIGETKFASVTADLKVRLEEWEGRLEAAPIRLPINRPGKAGKKKAAA